MTALVFQIFVLTDKNCVFKSSKNFQWFKLKGFTKNLNDAQISKFDLVPLMLSAQKMLHYEGILFIEHVRKYLMLSQRSPGFYVSAVHVF